VTSPAALAAGLILAPLVGEAVLRMLRLRAPSEVTLRWGEAVLIGQIGLGLLALAVAPLGAVRTEVLWVSAIGLGLWGLRRGRAVRVAPVVTWNLPARIARGVALAAITLAIVRAGATTLIAPLDSVDVRSVYGLRARAIFRANEPVWRWMSDPAVWRWHADYPPGLSLAYLSVATAVGSYDELDLGAVPFATALAFLLAAPAALARSGARGPTLWLFVTVLVASPGLWDAREAGHGEAPLALAWLLAIGHLLAGLRRDEPEALRRAVVLAASAALLKGEGAVLGLAFGLIAWRAHRRRGEPGLGLFVAAVAPAAIWATVVAFAGWPRSWNLLVEPAIVVSAAAARLPAIVVILGQILTLGYSGPWLMLVAIRVVMARRVPLRPGERELAMLLGAILALYVHVWVLSPYDVVWHVMTSGERIVAPLLVPAAFLLASPSAALPGERR